MIKAKIQLGCADMDFEGKTPSEVLLAAAKALSGRVFDGTYRMGDVVVADILGTGVDMVAGRHSGEAAKN